MTTADTVTKVDPITIEIVQSSLQAVSDEMFAAMRKTAMSAIIYEVLDLGTGITDGAGRLAASGAGIPAFVGVLDKAVRVVLERYALSEIREGDVFASNDPFYGAVTHLNDVVLLMPVFGDGELVAWTATIAHWNDVAGLTAGSMSDAAREIYQEGLRLPAIKLIEAGQPLRSVFDIVLANTRLPTYVEGDLWAGIAAVRLGERRIRELIAQHGVRAFTTAVDEFMLHGERVSLHAMRELPQGRFTYEEEQENGETYRVAIEIGPEEFVIDLRDNPDQDPGPVNHSRDATMIIAQILFRNVTDSAAISNSGTFAPLRLLTRPGSVFHASPPAAVGLYYVVGISLYDLLWRCLAPHLGGRLPAGSFGSICSTVISGINPDTGLHSTIVEPHPGGWGAGSGFDGNSVLFSGTHGDTFNCPAEIAEARYGVYVDQHRLNDEPGGEGRRRGGRGMVLDYRIRADGTSVSCGYSRTRIPPWGVEGGLPGSTNRLEIVRAGGGTETYAVATGIRVDAGDVVRCVSGGGGGWGEPRERDPQAVAEDVRDGYVTPERAAAIYGFEPQAGKSVL